jgi:hypothetical protein
VRLVLVPVVVLTLLALAGCFFVRPVSGPACWQISPEIALRTATQGETFLAQERIVHYEDGKVFLSSSCDGTADEWVDDAISVSVTHPDGTTALRTIDFSFGCQGSISTLAPQDLTALFDAGDNVVGIRLFDICGGVIGCSPLFIAVEHGTTSEVPDPCEDATGYSTRQYEWRYELLKHTASLRIPNKLLCKSLAADVPRTGPFPYADLEALVSWSDGDSFLADAARKINAGYSDFYQIATNTLHFVQALMPYTKDVGDYWQLPAETLERRKGDCEDGAVLYVAFMRSLGYWDSVRIGTYPGHAFAFVAVDPAWKDDVEARPNKCADALGCWRVYQSDDGGLWAMAETTVDPQFLTLGYWGLGCGCVPEEYWNSGQVRMLVPGSWEPLMSGVSLQRL